MDGFSYLPISEITPLTSGGDMQQTLKTPIRCSGVGLHSGRPVSVRLVPAPEDHGIRFLRTDLSALIHARFDNVLDTRLCTLVGLVAQPEARVGTIEHLMAALAAAGIDNVLVEVDAPEIPVLDGSAEPWLFLLDCAGAQTQNAPRRSIRVLRTVRVEDGDAFAELRPGHDGLDMALSIAFDAPVIGRQALTYTLSDSSFRRELARARTFALRHEIEGLQRAGLARGGSLDNAIVVDGDHVMNPTGLRAPDEFVRHKLLDAVGDLALAGGPLKARFLGHKSGHALNNRLLHALFADTANWRMAQPTEALIAA